MPYYLQKSKSSESPISSWCARRLINARQTEPHIKTDEGRSHGHDVCKQAITAACLGSAFRSWLKVLFCLLTQRKITNMLWGPWGSKCTKLSKYHYCLWHERARQRNAAPGTSVRFSTPVRTSNILVSLHSAWLDLQRLINDTILMFASLLFHVPDYSRDPYDFSAASKQRPACPDRLGSAAFPILSAKMTGPRFLALQQLERRSE